MLPPFYYISLVAHMQVSTFTCDYEIDHEQKRITKIFSCEEIFNGPNRSFPLSVSSRTFTW